MKDEQEFRDQPGLLSLGPAGQFFTLLMFISLGLVMFSVSMGTLNTGTDPELMLLLQPMTALIQGLLGCMTLLRFFNSGDRLYLYTALALLSAALLDIRCAHILIVGTLENPTASAPDVTLYWVAARMVLSAGIGFGLLLSRSNTAARSSKAAALGKNTLLFVFLSTFLAGLILPFIFTMTPENVATAVNICIPVAFALVATTLVFVKTHGFWRDGLFQKWLTISIFANGTIAAILLISQTLGTLSTPDLNAISGLSPGVMPDALESLLTPLLLVTAFISAVAIVVGLHLKIGQTIDVMNREVREHRQTQQKLRTSQNRLLNTLNSMQEGHVTFSGSGKILSCNPAFEQLFLMDQARFSGEKITTLFENTSAARLQECIHAYLQNPDSTVLQALQECDLEAIRSDNMRIRVHCSIAAMEVDGSRQFVAVMRDITARHLASEKLKIRERLMQVTGSLAKVGGWEFFPDTRTFEWSDELFYIHGLPVGQAPRPDVALNFFHPDDRVTISELMNDLIIRGRSFDSELRMITADKEQKIVRVMGHAIRNQGRTERLYGAYQDVTTLNKLKNEQYYFFDVTLDLICIADTDGYFRQMSPTWTEVFGWSIEELTSRPYVDFVHPDDLNATRVARDRMKSGEDIMDFEVRFRCKDGTYRWLSWRARVDTRQQLIYAIARDTTEVRLTNQELVTARQEAESAAKIKSAFLASMSHEIRTPMNAIIGMTDLLIDTPLNSEQRELATTVGQASESLLSIINDILDFSKIEAGKLVVNNTSIEPDDVITSVVNMLSIRANEKGLKLNCNISKEACTPISGDPMRLRQVLTNLLGNAIKFTESGSIDVDCSVIFDRSFATQQLLIEVYDTGIGIPADVQNRVFESFAQLNSAYSLKYGGTGLGLAISKELVNLMGGTIGFESFDGRGSRFWFKLPFQPQQRGLTPQIEDNLLQMLRGSSVLIVDNDEQERSDLELHFERWGADVRSASESETQTSILSLHKHGYKYDLVVFNNLTGDAGELELINTIRDRGYASRFLVFINNKTRSAAWRKLPWLYCLPKPIVLSSLLDTVIDLLRHQPLQSGSGTALDPHESTAAGMKITRADNTSINEAETEDTEPHILVVEDNPVNTKLTFKMLSKLHMSADHAENGKEALDYLRRKNYDIILMDCQMPVLDGYETTRIIREKEQTGDLPKPATIIAMTANAMKGDQERCLNVGMDDYMSKPMRFNLFSQKLMKLRELRQH